MSSSQIIRAFGDAMFPAIPAAHWNLLKHSSVRSSIQFYTLQGYISENRVIQYLTSVRGIKDVRKVPDYSDGHGGDVSFRYGGKIWTMEIKTLSAGSRRVKTSPTRKSDVVLGYRRDAFDLLAVCMSDRVENAILFVRTVDLPVHKRDPRFICGGITLSEKKHYAPFSFDLLSVLNP